MKVLQLFDMPAVQYTSLASIQERGEDNSSVNYQLCRDTNVMVIVHLCAPAPSAWLALLILDVISAVGDDAAQVLEAVDICQQRVVGAYVWPHWWCLE